MIYFKVIKIIMNEKAFYLKVYFLFLFRLMESNCSFSLFFFYYFYAIMKKNKKYLISIHKKAIIFLQKIIRKLKYLLSCIYEKIVFQQIYSTSYIK